MGSLAVHEVEQPLWLMSSLQSVQCHRLQTNRSPVESPPTAKKFIRSSSSEKPQQPSSSLESVDRTCNENRSILKGVDCNDRSKSWYAGQTARSVNFDQNVVVIIYDRADGEFVCCASQQLNVQPKDRRQFVSRTLLARLYCNKATSSSSLFDEVSAPRQYPALPTASGGWSADTARTPSLTKPREGRLLPCVPDDNSSPPITNTGFAFHEDRDGQLWLSFTVPLGRGVAAGDALVKANVAGNRVRVLGTRSVKCDATTTARQAFATRCALPVDVDPYAISARMDSTGKLFVEAPVMTDERRRRTRATADCTAIAN